MANENNIIEVVIPEYREQSLGLPYDIILRNSVIEERDADTDEPLGVRIPNLDGMVAAIAMIRCQHFANKLSGMEVRFLRKAMHITAKSLAEKMEVAPETFSRWENDKQKMSDLQERVLRIAVCETLKENAPAIDVNHMEIMQMGLRACVPNECEPLFELEIVSLKDAISRKKSREWDAIEGVAA